MELRHLRYFVAVAEAGSFTRAGSKLHVAQPALSRQMNQLEREVGVALFERHPRGVRLTHAGEAFLVEARRSLEHASLAGASARDVAGEGVAHSLRFAHGELFVYAGIAEDLLAGFCQVHPGVRVHITSQDDLATHDALVAGTIDVGCVLSPTWPPHGFEGHRLLEILITGVLLPGNHPLAAGRTVRLSDLGDLPWLTMTPKRWPGSHEAFEEALRARGLAPKAWTGEPAVSPSFHVAAGEGWMVASEETGTPYGGRSAAIAYRPFAEPPIPVWLLLVWMPGWPLAKLLVESAERLGLVVSDTKRESGSKLA